LLAFPFTLHLLSYLLPVFSKNSRWNEKQPCEAIGLPLSPFTLFIRHTASCLKFVKISGSVIINQSLVQIIVCKLVSEGEAISIELMVIVVLIDVNLLSPRYKTIKPICLLYVAQGNNSDSKIGLNKMLNINRYAPKACIALV